MLSCLALVDFSRGNFGMLVLLRFVCVVFCIFVVCIDVCICVWLDIWIFVCGDSNCDNNSVV